MKIKFISPVPYANGQDYFKEFFVVNKMRNSAFSYRFFATKVKWPASYLPDLIAGRKNLSLQRALQFSDFFKMNTINKEHLLWFVLSRSKTESTLTQQNRANPNAQLYPSHKNEDSFLLSDVIWVSRLLLWERKNMTAEQILENFEISSLSINRLDSALKKIHSDGLFQWNEDGTLKNTVLEPPTEFDHSDTKGDKKFEGIELHHDYAINFLNFIKKPQAPSTYHSRLVAIPREHFMPIALKIIELRNWIDDISNEHIKESLVLNKTSFLMQLDLNLFPIRKKN